MPKFEPLAQTTGAQLNALEKGHVLDEAVLAGPLGPEVGRIRLAWHCV